MRNPKQILKVTRSKIITADRFIEMILAGQKQSFDVPQKSWARSQLKKLIKYQNLHVKQLAIRANIHPALARRFKSLYADGYRVK